jgi:hypothetical protein
MKCTLQIFSKRQPFCSRITHLYCGVEFLSTNRYCDDNDANIFPCLKSLNDFDGYECIDTISISNESGSIINDKRGDSRRDNDISDSRKPDELESSRNKLCRIDEKKFFNNYIIPNNPCLIKGIIYDIIIKILVMMTMIMYGINLTVIYS